MAQITMEILKLIAMFGREGIAVEVEAFSAFFCFRESLTYYERNGSLQLDPVGLTIRLCDRYLSVTGVRPSCANTTIIPRLVYTLKGVSRFLFSPRTGATLYLFL